MVKSIQEKIIAKLEEYDLKIITEYDKDIDESFIILDNCTISINKKKELFISFEINTISSFAARLVFILNEVSGIKKFFIGEDYIFDADGRFLDGEEAKIYRSKVIKDGIVKEYINEQYQLYFLHNAAAFSC